MQQFIERHQDYVLTGITVPPNGNVKYNVAMNSDAPFALRCMLSSGFPDTNLGRATFGFAITGPDDQRYFGGNGEPLNGLDSLLNPASQPFIFYPQMTWPSSTTLQISITDISGAGISNAVLVFRGTKLYQLGTVFGPAYPPQFSALNFRYAYSFTLPLGTTGSPSVIADQPLDIHSDADFVVRLCSGMITAGDGFTPTGWDCKLRDQYGKVFSSDWVPLQLLFPQGLQLPSSYSGNGLTQPDVTIYPEIYLPKSTQLLLDLRRTSGTQNTTIVLVLHGAKIFEAN